MTKQENKNSAKKKLIPAVAMLTTSAIMLSTSTYAWFTMSREVEVSGIQMAATVPEDLQISLGAITGGELNLQTGIITNGSADTPNLATDWSNSAIISSYYEMGKLMPASSTNGQNIFFTPDADGVGKTVASEANYYQASEGLTAKNGSDSKSYMATLHAATINEKSANDTSITTSWLTAADGYQKSTAWNKTNDDGYYVDIPIWLRSSSDTNINLKVNGYVVPQISTDGKANKVVDEADIELYKAVRVAILNNDGTPVQSNNKNILPLADGVESITYDENTHAVNSITLKADKYSGTSIIDSANYTSRVSNDAKFYGVSSLTESQPKADGTGNYTKGNYEEYSAYDESLSVAEIEAATTGQEYGEAKKLVLRIWLDGEDGECWNQNAGQDFAITLKFSKIESGT